jgi:hypothetical protein
MKVAHDALPHGGCLRGHRAHHRCRRGNVLACSWEVWHTVLVVQDVALSRTGSHARADGVWRGHQMCIGCLRMFGMFALVVYRVGLGALEPFLLIGGPPPACALPDGWPASRRLLLLGPLLSHAPCCTAARGGPL